MKKKVMIFATLMVLALSMFELKAQAPGFDDDVNDVPLDGGISILVAAGVAYGISKVARRDDLNEGAD